MRIYKYLHSCLLVKEGRDRILFDPGLFSFVEGKISPESFRDLSLVIITHQHGDHVDIPALRTILKNNPVPVLTNTSTKEFLAKEGIAAEAIDEGEYKIGSFTIRAIPAEHGKILFPVPQNTAYLVNETLLHPGDSLDERLFQLKGVPLLALPIMAPWTKMLEVGEFASALKPKIAMPTHDGFAKDFFLERQYENYAKYFSEVGINFRPLKSQSEFIEVS